MKIIQIKNKPLRAIVSFIALLLMIAAGAGIIIYGLYGIGMVSPLTGFFGATEFGYVWLSGFLTLIVAIAVAIVAGIIIRGLYAAARASYRRQFRVLRYVVAWTLGIGASICAIYGIGLISPLTTKIGMGGLEEGTIGILEIWFGGYVTVLGAILAGLIIWGFYVGVEKLYHGPFDP